MPEGAVPVLECSGVSPRYGRLAVARDVELTVRAGQVLALLGPNGAGKTSTVEYLAGRVAGAGTVLLDGRPIHRLPTHRRVRLGLALVPENRGLFGDLTVEENLRLGTDTGREAGVLGEAYDLFPALRSRARQRASTLSGGEQQMLAVGRAIVGRPRLLILDEPTQGLAPVILDAIAEAVAQLQARGLAILLVEQNLAFATRLADDFCVLSGGRMVPHGETESDLADPEALFRRYMAG